MKAQTQRFSIICPPMELSIFLASTLILPWASLARADPVDPIPAGKLPDAAGLSESKGLSQQEQEDVVRKSQIIQQQLGGPLVQRYDLLQSIQNEQRLPVSADCVPTRQAPVQPAGRLPPRGQHAPHHHIHRQHGEEHSIPWHHPPIPSHPAPNQAASSCHSPGCPQCRYHTTDCVQTQGQPIKLLRETACELDRAANRLERANLYVQADALRELAQKLRMEARERQTSKSLSKKSP